MGRGIPFLNNHGEVVKYEWPDKPWAHKSMIISYLELGLPKKDQMIKNIICKLVRAAIYRRPMRNQLIIHTDDLCAYTDEGQQLDPQEQVGKIFQKGQPYSIMLSYSNDPIMYWAGTAVSLGYYAFKFRIEEAVCINLNPLVFETQDRSKVFRRPHLPIR